MLAWVADLEHATRSIRRRHVVAETAGHPGD
jgi:hypothetical protein